jgi:hypothetical protein
MIADRAIYQSLPDGPLQGARICIHRSQTKSIGRFLERVFTKSFPSEDPVGAHIRIRAQTGGPLQRVHKWHLLTNSGVMIIHYYLQTNS